MMVTATEKTGLQIFLEKVREAVGLDIKFSSPADLQFMLDAYKRGMAPDATATILKARRTSASALDYDAFLEHVKEVLRTRASDIEQQVQALSRKLSDAIESNGEVKGLLYFSYEAQDLPRHTERISVYNEFCTLLQVVNDSLNSAKLALDAARAEAFSRLVNMRNEDASGGRAAEAEALRSVLKILDNTL